MIRNEIGLYNRWGRFAFRWRTYRFMHHWIGCLKNDNLWYGYHQNCKFNKFLKENYNE